ncbi:helix-turn-helix transcriptional regulator [Halomicrococcus gelatinilyticus]|uniref:helix-turn-helix transcriptional regulator n=1 Tax=Halomicrococcus gelatinilyticus TaxID=1702103 RepID=UPI002E0F549F
MKENGSSVEYVLRSGARTSVLRAVVEGCDSTQALLDSGLASESAVYNALTELDERDLIHSPDQKRWYPTGAGTVVADLIERQRETETVLESAPEYWRRHDVTALPTAFRERLADLAGGEVVRATETRPSRAVREIERRLHDADSVSVITPIYNERFDHAARGEGLRLVLDTGVLEDLMDEADEESDEDVGAVRVADVPFALTVTDDCVLLSLPTLDGAYDPRTEFVVESERARQWGMELFERYWAEARSPEEFLAAHQ